MKCYKLSPCIDQSGIEVTTCGTCFTHLLKLHGPALLSVHASLLLPSHQQSLDAGLSSQAGACLQLQLNKLCVS